MEGVTVRLLVQLHASAYYNKMNVARILSSTTTNLSLMESEVAAKDRIGVPEATLPNPGLA